MMAEDNNKVIGPGDAKKIIASEGGTRFVHICLYNSLHNTGSAEDGINTMVDIYSNLMGLHGFMAGFQYVALEESNSDDMKDLDKTIFILRYFGFMTSLFGTILCLVIVEYLKTSQQELLSMQVRSMLKYQNFIQMGDYSAILATAILMVASNLIVWANESIPDALGVALIVFSGLIMVLFLRTFQVVIVNRQSSRAIYQDPFFIKAQEEARKVSFCAKLVSALDIRKSIIFG